ILVINPDNPTGAVYPEEILRDIVALAEKYDLFIVCDEVYQNMVYNGTRAVPLATLIGDKVPAVCMRGVSKEMPWPGGRCGWIEVYNGHYDPMFEQYINSILNAKMMEVCSTTLPQVVLPQVLKHPEYQNYLQERVRRYEKHSNIAYDILKDIEGIVVNKTNGAFYMSVAFAEGVLNEQQTLPIENEQVRNTVEKMVSGPDISPDKRFVYYLLGSSGVCVVPLSSFATRMQGFRITLLERDEEIFTRIFHTIAASIRQYLASA
ncbi:MAG: aminotransferase class I/II-fold pyridoxal phosphate-dependent enzyme, partial [Candidatus Electrothrix sp. EH2]|nr:aminotransferase class I/II-fold pyridoxal phosphate-dependent enzyme [Candidatus Electrothrix sp. EH2]